MPALYFPNPLPEKLRWPLSTRSKIPGVYWQEKMGRGENVVRGEEGMKEERQEEMKVRERRGKGIWGKRREGNSKQETKTTIL